MILDQIVDFFRLMLKPKKLKGMEWQDDPLSQPIAGSDFRIILKNWNERTDRQQWSPSWLCFGLVDQNKYRQDRSHQWSTRPAHSPGRQWLSLDRLILKFWDGRTDVHTYGLTDTLCENSDHYRPEQWSASWINRWKKPWKYSLKYLETLVLNP